MKRTKIDKLGRIVIPMNYRKILGITDDTSLMLDLEDGSVRISLTIDTCKLCNAKISKPRDIQICDKCINRIKGI